jgi:glycine cleavage system H protein
MYYPQNLLYSFNHLWLRYAGKMDAYVGITDYAQNKLKFISSVQIRPEGTSKKKGEVFGTLNGVNMSFDLIMPMDGRILIVNAEVFTKKPYTLNIDPYGFWLALLAFNNEKPDPNFLNAEAYKGFIGQIERNAVQEKR